MVKKLFFRFIIYILALSIVMILLQQILIKTAPNLISEAFPWILLLFITVSLAFHYFIIKFAVDKPKKFVNMFLGGTTAKLLIYLSTILIVIFTTKGSAKIFILNFAFSYLLFTFFELLIVLKQLKIIQSNNLKDTDLKK
ncbi:MAG: hypothetical protein RBS19_07940 [Bacteroidales bacterium]|nr:hypothetical protein [Bacteroidales bacterium]MDY0216868.1 hypothetical protein [Bacteroidales bacterium]